MAFWHGTGRMAVVSAVLAAALLCGCRTTKGGAKAGEPNLLAKVFGSSKPEAPCGPEGKPVATRVASGDVIRGHLYPDQGCQCFFFEGVESSLLDFEMSTDVGNEAAPNIEISTPDGKALPLRPALGPDGSAVQRAKGIVLPRTGTYRVSVCKAPCDPPHYWKFAHTIRLAPPIDQEMHLTAGAPQQVSFTVLAGCQVMVRVRPEKKCGLLPTVVAVEDPDGGRALDAGATPDGSPPPRIGRSDDGSMMLDFNAPKAGRYTVLLGAEKGTEGVATTSVVVKEPKGGGRSLYHGGWPCPEGPGSKPGRPSPAPRVASAPPPATPYVAVAKR